MPDQLIMNPDEVKKYVYDRKFFRDERESIQEKELKNIVIHNGYTTEEVLEFFNKTGTKNITYWPRKSMETHFWVPSTGAIHVVNCRGITRLKRDEDLAEALEDILQREIPLAIHNYQGDKALAGKRFKDWGFERASDAFSKLNHKTIERQNGLYVVMGPHRSLELNEEEVAHLSQHEYLNYQILNIMGKTAIHFDYIFSDQAFNIMDQLFLQMDAHYPGLPLHLFHYGKVGLLELKPKEGNPPKLQIGDVCIPTGAMDEEKIREGNFFEYALPNELVENTDTYLKFQQFLGKQMKFGITANSVSVLKQTKKGLQKLADRKCSFIEMEWLLLSGLDVVKSAYPSLGKTHYYLVGIGSDKPLEGVTLADTKYDHDTEHKVAYSLTRLISEL